MTPRPVLAQRDVRLHATVDATMAAAGRACGPRLACRPGCTECCIGPFPISPLDAERLARGLEELARRDPVRAGGVRARASAAAERLRPGLPETLGGTVAGGDAAEEAFLEHHTHLPCPALDPATGLCDLYAHRPIACRTFGPPMRIEGELLPPCRLCFVGAPAQEVEACRAGLDVSPVEAPLEVSARDLGFAGPTLVALALVRP